LQRGYADKAIDLALLADCLGDFLKMKDFEAIKEKTPNGYKIIASDSPYYKLSETVSISIEGQPNSFSVTLKLCGEKKRGFQASPFLAQMFGGGYFFLKKLRSDEDWRKFEKDFWRYLETKLPVLISSAMMKRSKE